MPPSAVVTETGIPFEAVAGLPSTDAKRHEKIGPAKRLATRRGSSALNSAIIEKRGIRRNTKSRRRMSEIIKFQTEKVKSPAGGSETLPQSEEETMNPKVIITCAVTGAGDTVGKHPAIPVTPSQIANAALEAADAGAAVVHCHVRNIETGKGARDANLYAEVVDRIRARNKTVIINLTAGMGGDVWIGDSENPRKFNEEL